MMPSLRETLERRERYEAVVGDVVAVLEAAVADRHMIGSVAAYLLEWALSDLTVEERQEAMLDFVDAVTDRLDGIAV